MERKMAKKEMILKRNHEEEKNREIFSMTRHNNKLTIDFAKKTRFMNNKLDRKN